MTNLQRTVFGDEVCLRLIELFTAKNINQLDALMMHFVWFMRSVM